LSSKVHGSNGYAKEEQWIAGRNDGQKGKNLLTFRGEILPPPSRQKKKLSHKSR
jgi:hypothetical protein